MTTTHATGIRTRTRGRDGYPRYTADRVDSAVTTWLVILTIVGVLGVVAMLWAGPAARGRRTVDGS